MRWETHAEKLLAGSLERLNTRRMERFGAGPQVRHLDATPLNRLLETGARLMWVAAHPDDESFAGAILAKAGPALGNPLHFVVLTRGEGGECLLPNGQAGDLGAVRSQELANVARLYGASVTQGDYFNAGLPVTRFPLRHELARRWADHGDPALFIARAIREFQPDVLLTFAPDFGSTGHPEHQLASRFATAAVRLASTSSRKLKGAPHRVPNVYYLLNKYWFTRLLGAGFDPHPYTELFPARQHCFGPWRCNDVMAEYTRPHLTQAQDMGMMRHAARAMHYLYLYRVDPFAEVKDPFEYHPVRGMG